MYKILISDFLRAAKAHEDSREGEDQADQNAPSPDQEYPAFFQQAPQKEIAAQESVQQPGQQPHQR